MTYESAAPAAVSFLDTTAEDRDVYAQVRAVEAAEQLGFTDEATIRHFPQLLTHIGRPYEQMIRMRYGMFPYDRPRMPVDIARVLGLPYPHIKDRLQHAVRNVRTASQSSQWQHMHQQQPGTFTIGELADFLAAYGDALDPDHLRILCEANGLPYIRPARRVAHTLQTPGSQPNRRPTPTANTVHLGELSSAELSRRMEAGWYAAGLLGLMEPTTQRGAIQQLHDGAVHAYRARASKEKQLDTYQRTPFAATHKKAAPDELRKPLIDLYRVQKDVDTEAGRIALTHTVVGRAHELANDPDMVETLHIVMEEGEQAYDAFLSKHIRLVFYAAAKLLGNKERAIEYGYIGLQRAARGFDATLGYSFATYAMDWIVYEMRKGLRHEWGITKKQENDIWKLRAAKYKLQQRLGATGISPKQLALATRLSEEAVIEYTDFIAEKMGYGTRSLNLTARSDNRTPAETADFIAAPPAAPEHTPGLRSALEKVFGMTKINAEEKDVICSLYGIAPYDRPHDIAEIAEDHHCSIGAIDTIVDTVLERIASSSNAQYTLHSYLKNVA